MLQKITDLNKKAVEAYENLEMEEARKLLSQALQTCAAEGLNKHRVKARTHINLGIVLIGGLKQRDQGIQQFKRALEIDPSMPPTKSLLNPEIQAAFDEASRDVGAGAAPKPPEPPKPEPPKPEPTAEDKPAADRPPKNLKGVFHEPVTEGRPGETITIKAAVESALAPEKVVLAYRPEGATDFLARDMEKDGDWYVARIPEPATHGAVVAYYIEARNRTGQPLAGNGSAGEPHVISLAAAQPQADTGETPGVSARSDEPGDEPGERSGGARRYWLSLGIGGGGGWAKGTPEVNQTNKSGKKLEFSGFAPANLMHIAPEIGIFYSPDLILSLQGRIQFVTGGTEAVAAECPDEFDATTMMGTCHPAKYAPAILAKATWLMGQPGPFRPFVSVMAGGGEIRHLITVTSLKDCGPNRDQVCKDTILGGRFLVGPSAGFTYSLSDGLNFVGSAAALAGIPNPTLNFDFNVGVAVGL